MNKFLNKLTILFMISLLFVPIVAIAKTVKPGETFTVTVGCGAIEGSVKASGNNATIISSDNWCDRGKTVSASAKAGAAGTASITFTTVDATNTDTMTDASGLSLGDGSVTVATSSSNSSNSGSSSSNQSQSSQQNTQTNLQQGSQATETDTTSKSNDASLASLQISDGTLSPAFKSGTTNYELSLPSDAESIKIEAKANDSKASVSGAGEISLKQGNNKIEIIVTAEDGTTKTYTINAYVEEKPEVYLNYHDQELGVVKNTDQVSKPSDAFEEVTLEIDGKEVTGWKNNIMEVTVLYMIDEESGEKNFYIYDTESKSITSIFKPVALLGNNLYIIDIDEDLQDRIGMTFTTVTVDEQELPGWTFDEAGFDSYCLIYVMNEQGEKQYYQYEATQNTLQLYSNAAPISTESYEKSQQVEKIAIILAGVFGVTTIAALIGCVVICRRSNLRVRRLVKKENLFEE